MTSFIERWHTKRLAAERYTACFDDDSEHCVSDQSKPWQRGFMLVMTTVFFWATLSIVMKVALRSLDPMTLTWARFFSASVLMLAYLAGRGQLGVFRLVSGKYWALLLLAAVMLSFNFIGYIKGVAYATPTHAQLLIQLAPILMTLGGIWVFKEPFARGQWLGLLLLVGGLGIYFWVRTQSEMQAMTHDSMMLGTWWLIFGAVTWAVYALIQKMMLARLTSPQILLVMYVVSSVCLVPWADFSAFAALSFSAWLAVAYCCINTLAAYGAFAEALNHWPASRVGALIATTPVFTLLLSELLSGIWPQWVVSEDLSVLAMIGLAVTVVGASLTSFWKSANHKHKDHGSGVAAD